jgi:plastocyanin
MDALIARLSSARVCRANLHHRRGKIALFLTILAALLVGVSADATTSVMAATIEVEIRTSLSEPTLTVPPGTSVTWINVDSERHRIRSRSGPAEFDSGNLSTGERFTFTFHEPGEYTYFDGRNEHDVDYWGMVSVAPDVDGQPDVAGTVGRPALEAPTDSVSIVDRRFVPQSLTVRVGDALTWTNADDRIHTVTARDGSFDSGIVAVGDTFAQTFTTAGSYPYLCTIHPDMTGTITVLEADGDTQPDSTVSPTEPNVSDATDDVSNTEPAAPDARNGAAGTQPAIAPTTTPTTESSVGAEIVDFAFSPTEISVDVGETVSWRNIGTAPHTVTATTGEFDSGFLTTGDVFSHTFAQAGVYTFLCTIHPSMTGTVRVAAKDQEAAGGLRSSEDPTIEPAQLDPTSGESPPTATDPLKRTAVAEVTAPLPPAETSPTETVIGNVVAPSAVSGSSSDPSVAALTGLTRHDPGLNVGAAVALAVTVPLIVLGLLWMQHWFSKQHPHP